MIVMFSNISSDGGCSWLFDGEQNSYLTEESLSQGQGLKSPG